MNSKAVRIKKFIAYVIFQFFEKKALENRLKNY